MSGTYQYMSDRNFLKVTKTVNLLSAGSPHTLNIFKIIGTIEITEAHAFITRVTTLTNLTGLYFDLWDGTISVEITDSVGGVLSNAPVGTIVVKDKVASEIVTCIFADQCRVDEPAPDKKYHQPFTVTQKNGVDTYIRARFASTDNPVNFDIEFIVDYINVNGGSIASV